MSRAGVNPKGMRIKTDAGFAIDKADLAHHQIPAAAAVAASNTAVHAAVNLGAETQSVTTAITSPAMPRGIRIKGNLSGITGDVNIIGTNYLGKAIAEVIALNGSNAVDGAKAFKTITQIDLPGETHAHAAQVETATVVGTISTAGNATVIITCTGMTGTPKTKSVAVALSDDAPAVATKIRAALAADADVTALFTVGGTGALITLTRLTPAANITNLNISIDNGTCAGLTTAATSADTTAGVAYDTVSVGFSDILGLPCLLPHDTVEKAYLNNVKEGTAPTVTTSLTAIESNTIDLNSALDGHVVDVYLMV